MDPHGLSFALSSKTAIFTVEKKNHGTDGWTGIPTEKITQTGRQIQPLKDKCSII